MSQLIQMKHKCALCGHEHEYTVILSMFTHGYPDLDTRPATMPRFFVEYEIQRCPNYNYANFDIEELIPDCTMGAIQCVYYQEIVNDKEIDSSAKSFILAGFLCARAKLYSEAGVCFLKAAWVSDDWDEKELAIRARQNAVECLIRFDNPDMNINIDMVIIDIYRRIGNFVAARNHALQLLERGVDEEIKEVLNYELLLIKLRDSSRHSTGDIPRL